MGSGVSVEAHLIDTVEFTVEEKAQIIDTLRLQYEKSNGNSTVTQPTPELTSKLIE